MRALDLAAFWEENDLCQGKPFRTDKPHAPLSMGFDDHFLSGVLPFDMVRYHQDCGYQEQVNREGNDILEREIGRRFMPERLLRTGPRRIEEVFESFFIYTPEGTPWLETRIQTIEDLRAMLQRVRKLDLASFVLPDGWEKEVARFQESTGGAVHWGTGGRGPATVGTSCLGTTNLCLWMIDYPDEIGEFYALLAQKYVEWARLLREATGVTGEGWWITDDNSCLFPPKQYERYCAPVLGALFDAFAPSPDASRYQHSDSAMGHLMPILRDLGVNGVNFGPTLHPADIRAAMPKALINGQIPPLVIRNETPGVIGGYVRRDFEAAGTDGGLVCTPAGSYDEGTPFENLRAYMQAVQDLTRYS